MPIAEREYLFFVSVGPNLSGNALVIDFLWISPHFGKTLIFRGFEKTPKIGFFGPPKKGVFFTPPGGGVGGGVKKRGGGGTKSQVKNRKNGSPDPLLSVILRNFQKVIRGCGFAVFPDPGRTAVPSCYLLVWG